MRFDLQEGFPAVTTKKLAFKSAVGEMVGFLRGSRNAAEFRALGCKVWDQNANENQQWLANPYRLGEGHLLVTAADQPVLIYDGSVEPPVFPQCGVDLLLGLLCCQPGGVARGDGPP